MSGSRFRCTSGNWNFLHISVHFARPLSKFDDTTSHCVYAPGSSFIPLLVHLFQVFGDVVLHALLTSRNLCQISSWKEKQGHTTYSIPALPTIRVEPWVACLTWWFDCTH